MGCGIGIGGRKDFTKTSTTKTPGPGNYNLGSFVDKYTKKNFFTQMKKNVTKKIFKLSRRRLRKPKS